jgi:hypothetical protein
MRSIRRRRAATISARPVPAALLLAAIAAASLLLPGTTEGAIPAWTTYHHDSARSGIDPDSASPLPPTRLWQTANLDGSIWAEPLVYGAYVYVATENDTIYAIEASSGAIHWAAHLGTPVPSSQLPCGDISPTVGITSTPVIDPVTNTIYAVTDSWDGSNPASIQHSLVALDLGTGALRPHFPMPADPVPYPSGGDAAHQLQRASLALDGNEVVIGYGGNEGDCGTYWGWLVAAPTSGVGPTFRFQVEAQAGHHGGAIWGSGNAPAVDSGGYVYAATGNGYSGGTFGYSESVLRLEANLNLVEFWAPAEWLALDGSDGDLGSSNPEVLPNGLVFQIGKSGDAVLLRPGSFGGIGASTAASLSVCGSWGGGIYVPATATSGTLYVSCLSGGLHAVAVSELNAPEPKLSAAPGWSAPGSAIGPPIYAGGLVWATHWKENVSEGGGVLYAVDPRSGAVRFEEALGAFEHFATPSAGGGRLFVANNEQVTALGIAVPPAPSPTSTVLSSSANAPAKGQLVTLAAGVSPTPDGGSVAFTDGGTPIAGCAAVAVDLASGGQASCRATFSRGGAHTLVATYSGDPYYAPSASAPLQESISALTISGARQSNKRWREGRALPQIRSGRLPEPTHGRSTKARRRRHRPPVGTAFSFSLSEPATVRLDFTTPARGQRVGGRCLALRHHVGLRRKRIPRCTRTVTVATLVLAARQGVDTVRFAGRTSRSKRLKPGAYTLLIKASTAAESASAKPLRFTIVKR